MKEITFYRCNICGNIICMVHESGMIPICCSHQMEHIKPNSVDATAEKHVPIIQQNECKILVSVGSMPHPMTEDHSIQWILLQTDRGEYVRHLTPDCHPEVCFKIRLDEHPIRAYTWCNLHGLWMHNLEQ